MRATLALFILAGLVAPAHAVAWRATLEIAQAEARTRHAPLFVEFTLPGCKVCERLEKETYPDPRVVTLLAEYVPVKIDMTVEEELAARYDVVSSPDLYLLDADGQVLDRVTRFVPPAELAQFLAAGLASRPKVGVMHVPWARDLDAARAESKRRNKPVFVFVWNYG